MKKIILVLLLLSSFVNAKKLVVLDPSAVEIIYMLGAESHIAGISTLSSAKIWPYDKTEKLPKVGTYSKPNLELVMQMKPDLVITSFHSQGVNADLAKFNIKTITLKADSIDEVYKNIKTIAKVVDKEQVADELVGEIQKKIESFANSEFKNKKIAVLFSSTPMMAFSNKTLAGDIFSKLGFINLADNMQGATPIISSETLLVANPDFIVMLGGMGGSSKDEFLAQYPTLNKIKAAKNGKIVSIPSSLLLRGTPRIKDSIDEIYKMLK